MYRETKPLNGNIKSLIKSLFVKKYYHLANRYTQNFWFWSECMHYLPLAHNLDVDKLKFGFVYKEKCRYIMKPNTAHIHSTLEPSKMIIMNITNHELQNHFIKVYLDPNTEFFTLDRFIVDHTFPTQRKVYDIYKAYQLYKKNVYITYNSIDTLFIGYKISELLTNDKRTKEENEICFMFSEIIYFHFRYEKTNQIHISYIDWEYMPNFFNYIIEEIRKKNINENDKNYYMSPFIKEILSIKH